MANRILFALKRLAVSTAIRLSPVVAVNVSQPEPRLRRHSDEPGALDAWLFEPAESPVFGAVRALSGELDRVSSALSDLRLLLANIARFSPVETVAVNAVEAANYRWSEDVLFEGDSVGFEIAPVLSVVGEQAFLFEDEPVAEPARWTVLRPALPERSVFLAA